MSVVRAATDHGELTDAVNSHLLRPALQVCRDISLSCSFFFLNHNKTQQLNKDLLEINLKVMRRSCFGMEKTFISFLPSGVQSTSNGR